MTTIAQAWKTNSITSNTLSVGAGQGWSTPTAGHLLVAVVVSSLTPGTHDITGWTLRRSVLVTDNDMRISVFTKDAAGTESTVTATSTASDNMAMAVCALAGVPAGWVWLDTGATPTENLTGTDTTIEPPAITTAGAAFVGVAAITKVLTGGSGATWAGGFTASGANIRAHTAHLLAGAGTYQPTGTLNSASNWGALMFAIQDPPAAGGMTLGLPL